MPRQRSAPAPRSAASAAPRPKPAASPPPPPPRQAAATPAPAAPAASSHQAPPPAPAPMGAPPPAMPQSSGGGMLSGFMGNVVTGVALGTGSAIAHKAVDGISNAMFGSGEKAAPAPVAAPAAPTYSMPAEGPCAAHIKAFAECMSKNNGEMGMCQFYFDTMQQCKTMGA